MQIYLHFLRIYRENLSQYFLFRLGKAFALIVLRNGLRLRSMIAGLPENKRYHWRPISTSDNLWITRIKVAQGEKINIPAPGFFGFGAQQAKKRMKMQYLASPSAEVYEFGRTLVVGGLDFLFHKKEAIHHDLFEPFEHQCPAENLGVVTNCRDNASIDLHLWKQTTHMNAAVSLIGQCSSNYAHWLTETLPKLAVLDASGSFTDFPLLVDQGLHPNIVASLNLINCHQRKVIEVPRWSPMRVDRLVVISQPGYERYVPHGTSNREPPPYLNNFSRAALCKLREAVLLSLGDMAMDSDRKIYLSRSRNSGNLRKITNITEIETIIQNADIQFIHPSEMTFREQVLACINAELIVGPIGASLANMIFAPKGCKIIALSPYYDDANYFYYVNLAGTLGHDIHFVLGEQVGTKHHPMHRNYHIDENIFQSVLHNDTESELS